MSHRADSLLAFRSLSDETAFGLDVGMVHP